jgi:putative transposase
MPFAVCYYHVIWTTKNRASLLIPEIESIVLKTIHEVSLENRSPIVALNGCENHIHVAVQINLSLSVSEWVKRVKGASARTVNRDTEELETRFRWQEGYGVLTFGEKHRPVVVAYIERQKEHHKQNTLMSYLERTEE